MIAAYIFVKSPFMYLADQLKYSHHSVYFRVGLEFKAGSYE